MNDDDHHEAPVVSSRLFSRKKTFFGICHHFLVFLTIAGCKVTDAQKTLRKMELLGQGRDVDKPRMKLGGTFLVKNPSKATHECDTCGYRSSMKGTEDCWCCLFASFQTRGRKLLGLSALSAITLPGKSLHVFMLYR